MGQIVKTRYGSCSVTDIGTERVYAVTLILNANPTATAQQKGVKVVKGKAVHYTKDEVKALQAEYIYKTNAVLREAAKQGIVPEMIKKPDGVRFSAEFNFETVDPYKWDQPKTTRPDGDNLAKGLVDAITKCGLWEDDCQLFHTEVDKYFSDECTVTFQWSKESFKKSKKGKN